LHSQDSLVHRGGSHDRELDEEVVSCAQSQPNTVEETPRHRKRLRGAGGEQIEGSTSTVAEAFEFGGTEGEEDVLRSKGQTVGEKRKRTLELHSNSDNGLETQEAVQGILGLATRDSIDPPATIE
jgi:hypothetical protein